MSISSFNDDVLARFRRFDFDAWQGWIEKWIIGMPIEPAVEVYDGDFLEALVSLYRELPEGPVRYSFAEAAVSLLNTTLLIESSSVRLSTLIGFVSYARPASGKAVIRRLLGLDLTWYLSSGVSSIHLQLLNAAGRYGVDSWLLRYLMTPIETNGLRHDLVCFRILVQNGRRAEAALLLNRILPRFAEHYDASSLRADESALKVEVTYAASVLGCSDLLRYAIDQQIYYEFDSIWVRCHDIFSQVLASALTRYLDAHELVEFLMNLPEGDDLLAGKALTALHRITRPEGAPLWDVDEIDDSSFIVTVGQSSCRMPFATHDRVFGILRKSIAQIERESRPRANVFDFNQSDDSFDDMRRLAFAA